MSYDLTVFQPDAVPRTRKEFMAWFEKQSEWSEDSLYLNAREKVFDKNGNYCFIVIENGK